MLLRDSEIKGVEALKDIAKELFDRSTVGAIREFPLHAMEIDPDEATREYKENIIGPFRELMPEDVIASMEENLSGPCLL
jgi:arsenite-transporting ATPase